MYHSIISNRRAKHFSAQISVLTIINTEDGPQICEVITARFYETDARASCCVWIYNPTADYPKRWSEGGARAGGYGYDRRQDALITALSEALSAQGVSADQLEKFHRDNQGNDQPDTVQEAAALLMPTANFKIIKAHP
jgi:hypothetical protein